MSASEAVEAPGPAQKAGVAALIPIVRRIVYARVANQTVAEDLVQETLAKVLGAAHRVEPGMLEPYAIVTARHLVASLWKEQDRHRRNEHRVVDLAPVSAPDEELLKQEERLAVSAALSRLSDRERMTLMAHEVAGQDTRSLGSELGMSAGAVAAQLNRSRAKLRVEYLLQMHGDDPPRTGVDRCSSCCPSSSPTSVSTGAGCARSGRAGSRTRTCSTP